MTRKHEDVMKLFEDKKLVKVCAPMVRYSKLQFRNLVREYGCDLCFTPMIFAENFCLSDKARQNDFTTSLVDTPVIVQFAANRVHDFAGAAYLVSPYCGGVDLNCGCPQGWARHRGIGCVMLEKPELISDLVKQCRNQIPKPFTVSVKTRIVEDLKKTVEICRQLEKAGVSFLSIHGRTPYKSSGDVNMEALRLINENTQCPLIANGGLKSLEECWEMQEKTKCKGVMVANGLLSNPTFFTGEKTTTLECVQRWVDICYNSTLNQEEHEKLINNPNAIHFIREKPNNLTFQCFFHHLVFMFEKTLPREKKKVFNNLQYFKQVLDFLDKEFDIKPHLFSKEEFTKYRTINEVYSDKNPVYEKLFKPDNEEENNINDISYDYETTDGKFFSSKISNEDKERTEADLCEIECENVGIDNLFIDG